MKYTASEGKCFALKTDLTIKGKTIELGANDSIDNWVEVAINEEGEISWHEPNCTIQIKLTHANNTRLLIDFPQFAFLPKQLNLPTYSDDTFVYIYANYLLAEHRELLTNYGEITE